MLNAFVAYVSDRYAQRYHFCLQITIPTAAETLRIKGVLILKRNATRDYLDSVALTDHLGDYQVAQALQSFDRLYQQDNGELPQKAVCAHLAVVIFDGCSTCMRLLVAHRIEPRAERA